ncbi:MULTISPECIES: hypothetical protein [Microcoleaceae]|uniref:hypothetical protein n=1 Tax=Microcoleaceae TaxID=1892252 RepID=UPI001880484B|nr:hypothetical protein [Tychonema sp. LEGE 06208]MBE9165565.1 hypothetical protein [Tychonema sp. LEGE 06208]
MIKFFTFTEWGVGHSTVPFLYNSIAQFCAMSAGKGNSVVLPLGRSPTNSENYP